MAEQLKPDTSDSNGPGNKPKEGEKLIFGKYKTMDEAERGYTELQRHATEKGQEAARYKDSLDTLLTDDTKPSKNQNTGSNDHVVFDVEGETEETFAQRFMENPKKFLKAIREQAKEEAEAASFARTEVFIVTREYISKFLDENGDLKTNGKLFALHLSQTNPKEKLADRLATAAKMTRDEVNRIKEEGKKAKDFQKNQADKANTVDDGGDANDADNRSTGDDKSSGDSFADYMKERSAQHAKFTS